MSTSALQCGSETTAGTEGMLWTGLAVADRAAASRPQDAQQHRVAYAHPRPRHRADSCSRLIYNDQRPLIRLHDAAIKGDLLFAAASAQYGRDSSRGFAAPTKWLPIFPWRQGRAGGCRSRPRLTTMSWAFSRIQWWSVAAKRVSEPGGESRLMQHR